MKDAPTAAAAVSHDSMANAIRFLSVDAVNKAASGHPGMPMGMADVATVLFTRFLKYDPAQPKWADRDRFILSAGHGSMLLYSLMYLTGYPDMTLEEIKNFRQLGAITAGHPEYGHASAAETTTGPLGQGLANAVGMALAERILAARFGGDVVDHYTYVIAGDGCLMEGISHEAISLAGHLKLNKLIVLFDDNNITIDGPTDLTVSDDQRKRFEASGWNTWAIDGHDPAAIAAAIAAAQKSDKPAMIACKTTIGYGAPTLAGKSKAHSFPWPDTEVPGVRTTLSWSHAPFEVPAETLSAWRAAGAKGAAVSAAWQKRVAAMDAAKRAEFERTTAGKLPNGWMQTINDVKKKAAADKPKVATRASSQTVLDALITAMPELIGGSADLTGSNNTKAASAKPITASDYGAGYIYYGVREHGMAAAMNGIALHGGLIPFGGTFMVFTDYARPAIRLSALMGLRAVYVMTHDSIGVGEDGPTHQPVEHLASLRAIPNLLVMRPCDTVETAECWAVAVGGDKPSILALTRQALPTLRTSHTDENLSAKGAYVLAEAEGKRQVTIIATGSEVSLAMDARAKLQADGIAAAVVSMPSWELFDAQPAAYRASVLGEGTLKIAVEAASTFGWERYVGPDGVVVGMTTFGASAPASELYKHFGITADAVVAAAKKRI